MRERKKLTDLLVILTLINRPFRLSRGDISPLLSVRILSPTFLSGLMVAAKSDVRPWYANTSLENFKINNNFS